MKLRCSWRVVVGLMLFAMLFLPLVAAAEFSARLVTDPQTVGPDVVLDTFLFEGASLATARLVVRNLSNNLLTIDGARSFLIAGAGEVRSLATLVGGDFSMALLPGKGTADTMDILAPLAAGDQLKLHLVWTLGAIVSSATWVWDILDSSAIEAAPAAQTPPTAPAAAAPAAHLSASTAAASHDAGDDFVIGLIGVALVLAVLGLVVWGFWSLTQ